MLSDFTIVLWISFLMGALFLSDHDEEESDINLSVEKVEMENGLTVLLSHDISVPTVSFMT